MCGIAGWIDWQVELTSQKAMLQRMADTLCHRGPDAQGEWLSSHAALAHRRLKVIDPYSGGQPMTYTVGNNLYAVTYNGEIYNFCELRSELKTRGHAFHTASDTEVLLHAYVQWGEECVHHLNGIFAFGLWDEQKQQLLLARDHMGVKPLFYAIRGSALLFGSELKVLLAHPLVKAEIDAQGMAELFSFRRSPGNGIYRDVHELRPGHLAIYNRNGLSIQQYWSLQSEPHTDDLATTVEHIRALLEDTVTRQLIADVPLVTMLSGGLDSSGLTALAARDFRREGKQLHTYSIDFVDSAQHFQGTAIRPSLDAPWVQRVADYAQTEHHTITIDTPELIENLFVPLHAHDFPTMGQLETSLYLLFKAMKQDATVALSGESADEVFGGYPWFHDEQAIQAPTFPWFAGMRQARRDQLAALSWLSPNIEQKINRGAHMEHQYRQAIAESPKLAGEDTKNARMREIFYLNLTYFLPLLLDRKDRMSMASGFEVRVPFCDYRLVQYVWNIPWEMKTVDNIEKGILRRAFASVLPDDVRTRKKSAYPTTGNPTYKRAICDLALHILQDANAPLQPLLKPEGVRRLTGILMAEKSSSLPLEVTLFPLEHMIQMNTWLKDYSVTLSL